MIIRVLALVLVCISVVYGQVKNSDWMGDRKQYLNNHPVVDMFLPGTHESSTYDLTNYVEEDLVPDEYKELAKIFNTTIYHVIKDWSTNQVYNIYEQLEYGIRFFDWRISWDGDNFRAAHMIYSKDTIDQMLDQLRMFLNKHKGEIVMLELSHLHKVDSATFLKLVRLIEEKLSPLLIPYDQHNLYNLTYAQMIDKNQRVFLYLEGIRNESSLIWPFNELSIPWPNQNRPEPMLEYNWDYLNQTSEKPLAWGLQFIITEVSTDIAEGLIRKILGGYNIDSMEKFCRTANFYFDDFMKEMTKHFRPPIMIIDRFEETTIVDWALILNEVMCLDDLAHRHPRNPKESCLAYKQSNLCGQKDVQKLCKLTCGLCDWNRGFPGQQCETDSDCKSGHCKLSHKTCLIDSPLPDDSPCGADYQCKSFHCNPYNRRCERNLLNAPCDLDSDCLNDARCIDQKCSDVKLSYEWLGKDYRLCRTTLIDCYRHKLEPVNKAICTEESECFAGFQVLCSNEIATDNEYFWTGCDQDCPPETITVLKNRCNHQTRCDGNDVASLCRKTISKY